MGNVQHFVAVCWVVLGAFWLVSAAAAKRTLRGAPWWGSPALRFGLLVVVASAAAAAGFSVQRASALRGLLLGHLPALAGFGALLCAAGVALAIWARVHIGRNWGMPMSLREGHELVTSGPYAHVRHPIYSGILLAMLGSALATATGWLIPFVVFGAYFILSARKEERDMCARFPAVYPQYRRRTKMLIPLVL